jgi:hypothetical protein
MTDIDTTPDIDLTPVHDLILGVIVKLRHDHPEFSEAEADTIRKALWEAWHTTYRIEMTP